MDCIEVTSLYLESELDCEIVTESSGNAAIDLLQKDHDFTIIFCDHHMEDGNGLDVLKYHKSKGLKVPIYLVTGEYDLPINEDGNLFEINLNNDLYGLIRKPFSKQDLFNALGEIKIYVFEKPYKKINIHRFKKYFCDLIDVYIQLSEDKFVKIVEKNTEEGESIIEKYIQKGIRDIFVTHNDFIEFTSSVKTNLIKKIETSEGEMDLALDAVELLHESIRFIDQKEESKEILNIAVKELLKVTDKKSKIGKLISEVMSEKNFVYELAILTNCIANRVLKETDWNSKAIELKISYASILMDATLEDPQSASYLTRSEVKAAHGVKKNEVFDHPKMGYDLVKSLIEGHPECAELISHHHAIPEDGFPDSIDHSNLNLLSCLFLTSHFMAQKIMRLKNVNQNQFKAIVFEIEQKFTKGNFKKIVPIFRKVFF